MFNILIFAGSARKGSYTPQVAEFVASCAKKHPDLQVELVSPQSVGINFNNEGNDEDYYPELRKKVEVADAYIVVTPEYNHGYSASTKYMLDLNLKPYNHKPVGFVGVSNGNFGGARAIEALVMSVREMGLVACSIDVNFSNDKTEIVNGAVVDPEKWTKRVERMLKELLWLTTTLKYGRDTIPQ